MQHGGRVTGRSLFARTEVPFRSANAASGAASPWHDQAMNSEADCLDANIDYGHGGGYFVRVDVELPKTGLYGATRPDGGPMGFLSLTDAEADAFAAKLVQMAERVRQERTGG